jgi:hypothetical protein
LSVLRVKAHKRFLFKIIIDEKTIKPFFLTRISLELRIKLLQKSSATFLTALESNKCSDEYFLSRFPGCRKQASV